MTLQLSGPISFSDLATEYSDVAPHSFSEFYRSGSLVPASFVTSLTAANLGGTNSPNARYPAIGGYDPQINTQSRLYTQALWGDNSSTITFDRNFTVSSVASPSNVPYVGDLSYYVGYYIQNATKTATHTLYVGGTQVATHSLTAGNSTASATGTLSVTAGQVIRVTGSGGSAGWAVMTVYIGGPSSTSTNTFSTNINSNVPTSGSISLNNFYGGRVS